MYVMQSVTSILVSLLCPLLPSYQEVAPCAMPAIVQRPTPPAVLAMWRLSAENPRSLLPYLDVAKIQRRDQSLSAESLGERRMLQHMAVRRLGDIGSPDMASRLDTYADELLAENERDAAIGARLAGERIRLRGRGREAYVAAMIEWVRSPAGPPAASVPALVDGARRVAEGARALGVLRAREAVTAIMAARRTHSGEPQLEFCLLRAAVRIGDPTIVADIRSAVWALAPYDETTKAPLEPDEPDVVWAYWRMRTQSMTLSETIQELVRALGNEPGGLRADRMLTLIGPAAVPAMLTALSGLDEWKYRDTLLCGLMGSLGQMRAVEAVRPVLDVLRGASERRLRYVAAQTLGQIGDTAAVPDLVRATDDPDFHLRMTAIDALAQIGDRTTEQALLRLTKDANSNIRCAAVEALATCGTSSALPALRARLDVEPRDGVRGALRATIARLSAG